MSENLIIVLVVAAVGLVAVSLGVQTAKQIWGRITWWNIIPASVLGIVRAAMGKRKQGTQRKTEPKRSQRMAHNPVEIRKIAGPVQFYWDGEYIKAANGQMLFEYCNNSFRRVGAPEMYRVSGDSILAVNGVRVLEAGNGKIKRVGGPVEYEFDGKKIKPITDHWIWEANQPVPTIVMLVCAGILKTP